MDEKDVNKIKKVLKIVSILTIAGLCIFVSVKLTSCVMDNSYDTKEILTTTNTSTTSVTDATTVSTTYNPYADKEFDKVLERMKSVDNSDLEDCALKMTSILLSSEISPYYKYMSSATYKVGKVSDGYKVDLVINDEKLTVICSKINAYPVIFIKDEPFTEKEKKFYKRIKAYHEVVTDEGKYSMQIW